MFNTTLKRYLKYNFCELLIILSMFFLSFPRKLSIVPIALIILSALYRLFIYKRGKTAYQIHWFLPLLFTFYAVSALLSHASWSFFEKNLLILLIPLSFGIHPEFFREEIRIKIYVSYILGNLTSAVVLLIRSTINSINVVNGDWVFTPQVGQGVGYDFLTSSVMGGNHYFGMDFSIFIDPTYFGLLIVFAQYLIYILAQSSEYKRFRLTFLGVYLFFLIILFLLSSKAAQISALFLIIGLSGKLILSGQISWKLKSSMMVVIASVFLFFFLFNPRLKAFKDTFSLSQFTSINPNARYGHDVRILSWDASLDIIKKHWLIGVGEGNKEKALMETYQQKGYLIAYHEKLNSHNQYLDFLLGGGVLGLSLFLIGLITVAIDSWKSLNFPLFTFVSLFAFNCCFENFLSRYWGILLFSVLITLLRSSEAKSVN